MVTYIPGQERPFWDLEDKKELIFQEREEGTSREGTGSAEAAVTCVREREDTAGTTNVVYHHRTTGVITRR